MLDLIIMGLIVAAIGIAVVFVILLILIFCIELISKIINSLQGKTAKQSVTEESEEVTEYGSVSQKSNAVVVAITAAIYAVLSSEGGSGIVPEFEIRKIRQIKR